MNTTGLNPFVDRIVELAAVDLVDGRTDRCFHFYFNPERSIDPSAAAIHGITSEMLSDKPTFRDIAAEFIAFIADAELIVQNADFDIAILNNELDQFGFKPVSKLRPSIIDTLKLAKELHPKQKNTLDTLCSRYGISTSVRNRHGALLNATLLAQVYLAGFASLRLDLSNTQKVDSYIWIPDIERELVAHLLRYPNKLYEISPRKFEELVASIFRNNGFSVELTPRTRDGGVDIIAVEHSTFTGNSIHLIECKRYTPANKVGIGVVQRLLGTVTQRRATKGVLATTSSFTHDAVQVAEDSRHTITLNDYNSVVGWLRTMDKKLQ